MTLFKADGLFRQGRALARIAPGIGARIRSRVCARIGPWVRAGVRTRIGHPGISCVFPGGVDSVTGIRVRVHRARTAAAGSQQESEKESERHAMLPRDPGRRYIFHIESIFHFQPQFGIRFLLVKTLMLPATPFLPRPGS